MTHPKDPQADIRELLEHIGLSNGTIREIEAMFQAHQQELLSEILEQIASPAKPKTDYDKGWNDYRDQVVSVIERKIGELNG